jgi:colanic acid/amylovoran biosynthesis glycosyltransferase
MGQIAYLFPVFPVFHQTFVLWEVLGLRRSGMSPKLYSLRRPRSRQQPEAQRIAEEVTYLPRLLSWPVLRANARRAHADPRGYGRLYRQVWKAWRTGARPVADGQRGRGPRVSLYNRWRGWFNSQPILYLLKSWLLVPTAVDLADRLRADGVSHLHVHWASYPATVAYVVHLISGLPFSISAHAYDIYMVPRMLPAKMQAARFLVTCAKTNASFLTRLAGPELGRKVIVSYHGVDVARFAPAADGDHASRQGGSLTIVSCGQLERYKGMHLLVEACARMARRGVAFECWIVGEGPERVRLQGQIERLGLSRRVHLTGSQSHAEVAALFRRADVFALASELAGRSGRRDVIANVIVEAMAAALPVVVSHIPGVEELVDDRETGYLVRPNDVDQLVDVIVRLAESPEERLRVGQAARRRVLRDFDNRKNVGGLARVLQAANEGPALGLAAG